MQHQLYLGAGRVTATFCRRLAPFAAVLAVTVLAAPMHAQILPSDGHETIEESHVLLDAVPIRPLIVTPAGDRVWAVNVQGNCVQEFVAAGAPSRTFDVPWNPISIAWYHSTDPTYPGEKLLVVCRGTYALVSVDLTTGKVDRMLRLPAQPADLIVDATPGAQRAFVSCQADDEVVDVDLGGRMSIVRRFEIPGKTPTSLFFDANGDVMVAPLHSGNNSGVHKAPGTALQPLELGILDFDDPAIAAVSGGFRGLPDQDLFRCVRSAIPPAAPVTSVARSLGTLLYSAALNATTNSWWVLHTDAKNKDPNKQTEADIRGEFATNRLVIVDRTTGAKTFVSLDSHAIGHPDGIAMAPGGWAFLVGTQTDNVALLDPTGTVQFVWNVPDGSIPRQVVWNTALNSFFVHCWGRNTVEAYSLGSPPLHWGTFDLGLDPTSDARKAGRKLFYDGANSLHGNLSCETCHAYGEMDFLAWNLSHGAAEEKGPLVTQTLRGIDGTMPFHWRGEQQKGIEDFNPAFAGLLGGAQLPPTGLKHLSSYLLGLRGDANPHQHADRDPVDSIQPPLQPGSPTAHAVTGEGLFLLKNCLLCHAMPTGSSNEVQRLGDAGLSHANPRRQRFEVGTFNGLWKKHQDADPTTSGVQTATVVFAPGHPTLSGTEEYPLLGYGFGHAGTVDSLHEFLGIFMLGAQDTVDIAAFVDQFDQRMAPMSHEGYLLDSAAIAAPGSTVVADVMRLLTGADTGQGDVAAFGTSSIGGVSRRLRWRYDPTTRLFVPEVTLPPTVPPVVHDFAFFQAQATAGSGANVFVGLPRGTSTGFAIDYDLDDFVNLDEVATGTSPYARDSDGDSWWDGHELANHGDPLVAAIVSTDTTVPTVTARVVSVTTRNAVLVVEADEPVTVGVSYSSSMVGVRLASSDTPARVHRIVLDDLEASTGGPFAQTPAPPGWDTVNTYSILVVATDLANLSTTPTVAPPPPHYALFGPAVTTPPFQLYQPIEVELDGFTVTSSTLVGSTLHATVKCDIRYKAGAYAMGATGYVPVYRVFQNGVPVAATGVTTPTTFDFHHPISGTMPYASLPGALPGPFLVADTPSSNGNSTLSFQVPGVALGDDVTLHVEFVGKADALWTPAAPVLESIEQWDMPSTPAAHRQVVLQ